MIDASIQEQISAFIALVESVNTIPDIKISLENRDPQRDALAFIVYSFYLQFQEDDWSTLLRSLPNKIRQWNTPPDAYKATTSLLELIRHLYDFRVLRFMNSPSLSKKEKEQIQALHKLFQTSSAALLKKATLGNPVYFGGISPIFLPSWYLNNLN